MAKRLFTADVEADDLLSGITKIWCATFTELDQKMQPISTKTFTDKEDYLKFFQEPDNMLVMHNGINYDARAIEKVHGVKAECEVIDTMYLSWYLYPKRRLHGLASHGEDLGIAKPEIEDWENLTIEEYIHRCEEDVRIQTALWQQMWKHLMLLYGTPAGVWRLIRHLNLKAKMAVLKEESRWKLDEEATYEAIEMFADKVQVASAGLDAVMPDVAVFTKKSRPKKPFKMDGELSAHGLKWQKLCEKEGIDFDSNEEHKVQTGWKGANCGSHIQLKSWLFSLKWEPTLFKHNRNKETNEVKVIPQIRNKDTGDLCENIKSLMAKHPELHHLQELSVVKHRLSVCNGFIKNMDEDGYVFAGVQGLTNTLRYKHKICVNIPSNRKPYGPLIRGLLIARNSSSELCGSDMCSLEDRTKQHYMWKHDPEYVRDMMADDFDPHLDMALAARMITPADAVFYRAYDKENHTEAEATRYDHIALMRHGGKSCNYAATYGAKGPTIARAAGLEEHEGNLLYDAYWERNWAINAIADECKVKTSRGMKWIWNPVAKMWFYLKADKDRFSTLNQGTGTFAFDRWVYHIFQRREQLTADFHDEVIMELRKGNRDAMSKILKDSIQEVNDELKLDRELDCDIDFGDNYAEIH